MPKGFEGIGMGVGPNGAQPAPYAREAEAPLPNIRRRPKTTEPIMMAAWYLDDSVKHIGVARGENDLLANEHTAIQALVNVNPQTWAQFGDVAVMAALDDYEYWIASAMLKLSVDSIGGLLEAVK